MKRIIKGIMTIFGLYFGITIMNIPVQAEEINREPVVIENGEQDIQIEKENDVQEQTDPEEGLEQEEDIALLPTEDEKEFDDLDVE